MSSNKSSLDKIISGTNTIVNFIPRTFSNIGKEIDGRRGEIIGTGIGYVANIILASTIIGPITAITVGVASPISYSLYQNKNKQLPPYV